MALYAEQSPTKMMLNSQRLSAMIDSFNSNEDDEKILSLGRESSPTKEKMGPQNWRAPIIHADSPKNMNSPAGYADRHMGDNRLSMISNYSGVVHEGVEVSYVVQNRGTHPKEQRGPSLPALPSQEALAEKDEVTIETIPNAKPVGRLNSTSSTVSASSHYSDKTKTDNARGSDLRLLPVNRRQMAPSSIGSGNLASESGSSYFQHVKDEERSPLLQKVDTKSSGSLSESHNNTNSATATDSSDNYSIATSIIPPLATSVKKEENEILPNRSETNSYNPTIPPRNKNRPRSRLFIRDTLDDIENQLMEQMRDPITMEKTSNEITRTSSSTNKSDTYFSATSFQEAENHDIHDDIDKEDQCYLGRPLPTVPIERQIDRNSTIRAKNAESRRKYKNPALVNNEDYEDQYEDIDDPVVLDEDRTPTKSRHTTKGSSQQNKKGYAEKKKSSKKRQEIRSFDVDTLSQLLNVTKGTLVGAEFANLGMKVQEKRALERLVDSLSRLTADMVLDPERYEEGLKRLDKATRALEGF